MVDRTHGETKLWESFIKGETAAFEEVYRRYYSLLYSYGIRMVGDRELVADTMTVERIRAELQRILYDEAYRRRMLDGYEYMASRLGEAGAPAHAARKMVALLKKRFKK